MLKELMLIIKQGFKFLNTFLEFRYYQAVLLFRFSKQIRRTIVILYPVVVMNFPACRHWFAVSLFPHKDMLKDIEIRSRSRMSGPVDKHIPARMFMLTTFPISAVSTFPSTFLAVFSSHTSWVATYRAGVLMVKLILPSLLQKFFSILQIILSIHSFNYSIKPSNMQGQRFSFNGDGIRFTDINRFYGEQE